jgi:YggT family protein
VITIIFEVLDRLLGLYLWVVIIAAIFVTLASFGVLDTRNRIVWSIGDILYRLTEPALRPIRRILPNLGGLDLSPLVLILIVEVLRMILARVYIVILTGNLNALVL